MTREERKNAIHCLKVMADIEVCEECDLYGTTGTDHCEFDCVMNAIEALEQEPCEDAISRAEAQTAIEMSASRYTIAREHEGMGQVEWSDQLIKVSDTVDIIRNLPSVKLTEQESQTFEWCTDCQEYNQEKHCCPRYNKVIRNTVEEIKEPKIKVGHWKPMWYDGYADGCPVWEGWDCSECGYEHNGLEDTLTNYCPNCGAKMIEPQESEET